MADNGGFWIAFANPDGSRNTSTEVRLSPSPSRVEYPIEPLGTRVDIPNGSLVAQVPLRDARPRRWVWEGYPASLVAYAALWARLEPLRARYRYQTGNSPYIWVRDQESKQLRTIVSAGSTVTSTYDWYRVLVHEVSRKQEKGTRTSMVVFATTILGFTVADTGTYNDHG